MVWIALGLQVICRGATVHLEVRVVCRHTGRKLRAPGSWIDRLGGTKAIKIQGDDFSASLSAICSQSKSQRAKSHSGVAHDPIQQSRVSLVDALMPGFPGMPILCDRIPDWSMPAVGPWSGDVSVPVRHFWSLPSPLLSSSLAT